MLVYINTLSGTHQKREPLVGKDSDEVMISALCNFLYIGDMTAFLSIMNDLKMNKKCTFYSYASTFK